MEQQANLPPLSCSSCSEPIKANARFCHKCGTRHAAGPSAVDETVKKRLSLVFGYYFTSLAFIVLLRALDFQTDTSSAITCDALFACITIGFVIQNFKEIRPLFSFANFKFGLLGIILVCEAALAFGVHIFSAYINQNLFDVYDQSYYYLYQDSVAPAFFMILSIAVFPAIFEELGFRGVVFNHLSKITGRNSVIIVSAALFAVIHLSLISLIWILPLGLLFGYLRDRYNTLWYGIIGHFAYNSFIVLYELFYDGLFFQ
jgi:uncharacterized protein